MKSKGWSVREDKDRDQTARRHELLMAARAVFEERGYGAATIADITSRAQVSRATFYVYFASKQEVFAVLADLVRDRYLKAQDIVGVEAEDVIGVLRATIGATLDVTVEHLSLMTLLDHQAIADPDIRKLWVTIRQETVDKTAGYFERAESRGLIKPVAAAETVAMLGVGMNEMFAPRVADRPDQRDYAVEQMLLVYTGALGIAPA